MQRNFDVIDNKLVEVAVDAPCLLTAYASPDEKEKRYLVDVLKLDEHTLQSALDPDELSRLEFEPEHVALIVKRPRSYSGEEQFLFKVSSVGAFLFKDRLVVVMPDDVPLFGPSAVFKRRTPPFLLLRIINRTISHFLEHLKVMAAISDELQDKINHSMENRHLLNLFTLEKSLVYYLNSINSNGMLIEKLKNNAQKIGWNTEEAELLDDTQIENSQCYKQAEIYSNIIASLMDARASIVGNNLNVLMKTLNIITIAIMVPTLVVSAFSMNVPIPLQHHPASFWGILLLAAGACVSFVVLWRRKKWW